MRILLSILIALAPVFAQKKTEGALGSVVIGVKSAPRSYVLSSGKLLVDRGQIEKVNDSTSFTKYDTVKTENSTDSTRIRWVSEREYEIDILKDMPKGYSGSFDKDLGKAFEVGDIIGMDGKRRPAGAVLDYTKGMYSVPGALRTGEIIDPGYGTLPNLIGPSPKYASGDSTRPLPDTTGDQIVFWFTGDSVKAGKFLNLIGNDTGYATAGAIQVPGGAIANSCSLSGADSIWWADKASYRLTGQISIMQWIKPVGASEAGVMIGKALLANGIAVDANSGYDIYWAGASNRVNLNGAATQLQSAAVFVDADWVRYSFVNDDSARIFRNGVPAGVAAKAVFTATTNKLMFGFDNKATQNATYIFQGCFDRTILADTAISRVRRNSYMISKRETPTSIRDTVSGMVWIDTAGNQCDSVKIWNPTANKTVKYAVVAGNLYDITGAFTLDTTYIDSASDTVNISQGRQIGNRHDYDIHSRDTLRTSGINNIGIGDSAEYVLDFYKAINNQYYSYDTLFSSKGETEGKAYKKKWYHIAFQKAWRNAPWK